jgi:hypothetical protein
MSNPTKKLTCDEIVPLFVFYVCFELDKQERSAVDEHIAACENCRTQLAEEQSFGETLASIPQDADELDRSGIVLSQCRSELAEQLDDLARPAVKDGTLRFAWFRRWMVVHPAWSGAALVLVGLVLGAQSGQWFASRNEPLGLDQAVNVRPGTQLTDDQLSKMAVAGINLTPSPTTGKQNVRLQLSAEQPVVLTGNLDDSDVRRVLTYVVKNGERFNPGVRLDCLDALKSRSQDKEVRSALLEAARKDQNPAVRLKALEALRDSTNEGSVREALLEALQHDTNPGVRVEAVNLLVRSLEEADGDMLPLMPSDADLPRVPGGVHPIEAGQKTPEESMAYMIQTLEQLQQKDPSRYVRLQSAAALREISDRREH